jgi:hypothetical protein
VRNPIGGNLAAFADQVQPGGPLTDWLGERFISRSRARRLAYLEEFYSSKADVLQARRISYKRMALGNSGR